MPILQDRAPATPLEMAMIELPIFACKTVL